MVRTRQSVTQSESVFKILKITIRHIHRDRDLGADSSDDLRPNFRRSRHRLIPSRVPKGAILGKFDPVIFGRAPPTRPARAIFSDMMTFVIDETHGHTHGGHMVIPPHG